MSAITSNTNNFCLHLGVLTPDLIATLTPDFDTLKPSEYKDGGYRFRRYSKCEFDRQTNTLELLPATAFVQDDSLNQFQGNLVRTYDDLTDDVLTSPAFLAMCQALHDTSALPARCELEVHQMRIIAKSADQVAEATPEGVHQDGFDYVGVFTVSRHNQTGGQLLVWQDKQAPQPVADLTPKVGDYCVINDRQLWHSASPVAVQDENSVGYWDLFVITANLPQQQVA